MIQSKALTGFKSALPESLSPQDRSDPADRAFHDPGIDSVPLRRSVGGVLVFVCGGYDGGADVFPARLVDLYAGVHAAETEATGWNGMIPDDGKICGLSGRLQLQRNTDYYK